MKFFRSLLLLCFLFVMNTVVNAQPDSGSFKIIADTTIKDTIPSRLFVASISIYGNKKTKDYIIQREIPFKQGEYVTPEQLAKDLTVAKQQLINTSLFLDVSVYIENRYGEFVFITVYVKERWYVFPLPYFRYVDPNFNTWWVTHDHSLKRTNYGIKFLHNNISGRNDKLTAWFITGYSKQIALKYERPYFDKQLKSGYSFYVGFLNQRELNYATDSNKQQFFRPDSLFYVRKAVKAEASYIYRPGLHFRHIFRIGYMYEDVADTIVLLNKNYFAGEKTKESFPYFGYTLRYTNADYNFYPTKGFLGEASVLHRGITSDMNLTQFQFISTYTLPVLPKTQLQFKEGAIINVPFKQPFYNKALFGYSGYMFMHGYEYYVVDGDAGVIGRMALQHELFDFKMPMATGNKNQLEIPFRFFGKIYTDAGYAYDNNPVNNSLLNNKFLHSWGLGIDMITAYDLIFKFEYSFNQLGGNGLFIHVAADF
ncbi:MAG: hypothetical protein JO072_03480 [Parafilimonas sp.]|nr:hypothetical protein [Parafilimonas sp.]